MGLDLYAKGCELKFHIGYMRFADLRTAIVKAAYDAEMYRMYHAGCHYPFKGFTEAETYYWNNHCNDDLDLLIWHSDCDGVLKSGQCKKIYNAMKDLCLDSEDDWIKEKFAELKTIIKWCADNRKTLVFG